MDNLVLSQLEDQLKVYRLGHSLLQTAVVWIIFSPSF